jgi:DNA processing protein
LEELKALIGLRMCEGIGDISAFKLLSFCGSASAVFEEKKGHLSGISGISTNIQQILENGVDWALVDKELEFIDKNHINYISIFDPLYPKNLLTIDCPPPLLFFKGDITKLNQFPCISIVGTRNCTRYGTGAVTEIIDSLKSCNVNIISGLAHGIDIASHKECLEKNIPTFGIVGHGLKTIYPAIHTEYANEMIKKGGAIISEFFSEEIPNRENFPKRNRIIAGISSSTIVIEAAPKSGTLITAELALKYNRKVFVLPGRYNDKASEGCNVFLQNSKAKPITSIPSLYAGLGFAVAKKKPRETPVVTLDEDEQKIYDLLSQNLKLGLDNIAAKTELNISFCTSVLFNLEMMGLIKSLPGKAYELL